MITKARFTGFLMTTALVLSAPVIYADTGNGGNLGSGQTTATAAPAAAPTASAVAANPSTPEQEHGWKHGHWARHGHHMAHRLNLTDDQKKAMKDIWQKQKETMKATFGQIKTNREAYNKEITQETPDMNKVNDLQAQFKTIQAQMVDNRLNSTLEVKKILNPEQFGKYLEFQKHEFARHFHKEGRGHRGGWHKHHGDREEGCSYRDHRGEWNDGQGE